MCLLASADPSVLTQSRLAELTAAHQRSDFSLEIQSLAVSQLSTEPQQLIHYILLPSSALQGEREKVQGGSRGMTVLNK